MKTLKEFRNIVRGSKTYEFHGDILTITSYYSNESVKLDLSMIDEEILDQLQVDEDEDEEWGEEE